MTSSNAKHHMADPSHSISVFISYSHADAADFALWLATQLKNHNMGCWLDRAGIIGGSEWDLDIERAIQNSSHLLAIITPKSVTSSICRAEIGYALELGKTIIPLILIDATPPLRLINYHYIDFKDGSLHEESFSTLLMHLSNGRTSDLNNSRVYLDISSKHNVNSYNTAIAPPFPFVGRTKELNKLEEAFTNSEITSRISLVGIRGVGKTALAAQLVEQLSDAFPGGCFWVNLASYDGNPFPILETWGNLCGLVSIGHLGDPVIIVRAAIAAHIKRYGRLIIVLDDVRRSWLEGTRKLMEAIPSQSNLLVTTHDQEMAQTLNTVILPLEVLGLPDALLMLQSYLGVFVQQYSSSDLEQLALRLGCLPIALELAGKLIVRYSTKPKWNLSYLLGRLNEESLSSLALNNHGILATFEISYHDLSLEQQQLFCWLGILASHVFTTEWIARIIEFSKKSLYEKKEIRDKLLLDDYNIEFLGINHFVHYEELLDKLVSSSLLQWVPGGYQLHPLIKDYAESKLRDSGEFDAAIQAHSEVFLQICRTHRNNYIVLEEARSNILVGMNSAYKREDWQSVRLYMWGLGTDGRYMITYGYWGELQECLEKAIVAATVENHTRDLAAFNINLGIVAQQLHDYEKAWTTINVGLSYSKKIGDSYLIARGEHQLGLLYLVSGDFEHAKDLFLKSIESKKTRNDLRGLANSLAQLGTIAQSQNDFEHARELYNQSLELFTRLNNPRGIAAIYHQLGVLALAQKHFDEAEKVYQRGLHQWKEINDKRGMATAYHQLGVVAQLQRDYKRAYTHYEQSCLLKHEIGDIYGLASTESNLATIAYVEGDFERTIEIYDRVIEVFHSASDMLSEATSYYRLGLVLKAIGKYKETKEAFDKSLKLFSKLNDPANIKLVQKAIQKLESDL